MKRISLYSSLLALAFVIVVGCGGDPNVEGAKLALTLDDVNYADYYGKLDESIANDPANTEAYLVYGKLIQRQAGEVREVGEHTDLVDRMLEKYHQALELEPANADVIQQLRQAYVDEFRMGFQAFQRGRQDAAAYNDAVTFFTNTTRIQPDSIGPYINLGYAYINSGQTSDAIGPLQKAIDMGESENDTYMVLAELYQANGEADTAIGLLEEAQEKNGISEDIQSRLLNAYISSGQVERAMQGFVEALAEDPTNELFLYNYGTLLLETEDYDAAAEQFQKAVDVNPEYGTAWYNLGATYVNKAVEINEEIQMKDDDLRANRSSLSNSDIQAREAEMDAMVEERTSYFENSIEPLEKARMLMEAAGEDVSGTCNALFRAYLQVGMDEKAEDAAACAGIDLN